MIRVTLRTWLLFIVFATKRHFQKSRESPPRESREFVITRTHRSQNKGNFVCHAGFEGNEGKSFLFPPLCLVYGGESFLLHLRRALSLCFVLIREGLSGWTTGVSMRRFFLGLCSCGLKERRSSLQASEPPCDSCRLTWPTCCATMRCRLGRVAAGTLYTAQWQLEPWLVQEVRGANK